MNLTHLLNKLNFIPAWEAKREYNKQRRKSLDDFVVLFNSLVKASIKHGSRYLTISKPDILTVSDFEILLRELGYSIESKTMGSYRISYKDKIGMQVQIVKLQ